MAKECLFPSAQLTPRSPIGKKTFAAANVSFDIAMLEGVNGIQKLLTHVPLDRLLFGSYFPFYAWEAAELKLRESPLAEAQRVAIAQTNAEQLIRPSMSESLYRCT